MTIKQTLGGETGVPNSESALPTINGGHGSCTNGVFNSDASDALFNDVNAFTPQKKLRIITIGAGFSGLLFAHKLQHQYPEMQEFVENTIFEVRHDIGGTWLANNYPGRALCIRYWPSY